MSIACVVLSYPETVVQNVFKKTVFIIFKFII